MSRIKKKPKQHKTKLSADSQIHALSWKQTVRCDSSVPDKPFQTVRPLLSLFKCAQITQGGQTAMQK